MKAKYNVTNSATGRDGEGVWGVNNVKPVNHWSSKVENLTAESRQGKIIQGTHSR